MNYIFKTKRLGFRLWKNSDLNHLVTLNTDKEVMRYFPKKQNKSECEKFITKMNQQFEEKQYCYFAVELIENNQFIGFIGLSQQIFNADFLPAVDIGWRLNSQSWGKGYATEGAQACLNYGFNQLHLKSIISIAPKINIPSENIMKRIGMKKVQEFKHPLLKQFPLIEDCVLYKHDNM